MSCETIKIRVDDGLQNGDPEVSYACDSGKCGRRYILGLRLYLDGAYVDPPSDVLPPRPAPRPFLPTRRRADDDDCIVL